LVKHLVDCDGFTFIQVKTNYAEVFNTTHDSYVNIELDVN
jgi:hypothetical protein